VFSFEVGGDLFYFASPLLLWL